MRARLAASALGLCLLLACSPAAPAVDAGAELEAIRALEQAQTSAVNSDDVEGAMAMYSADAVQFIPFEAPFEGADAIRAGMEAFLADPNAALNVTQGPGEVAASGELAYTTTTYTVTFTDEETHQAVTVPGRNVTIWKKDAQGAWKAIRDINIAMPEPAAPSAPAP